MLVIGLSMTNLDSVLKSREIILPTNIYIVKAMVFSSCHVRMWESDQIRSDQSLSHVRLFATPWIAACQASMSITNSRSSLRLTSIESVITSSWRLAGGFSFCPLLMPMSDAFSISFQFSSVAQSCPTLCDPMNRSMPGRPVHHQLPEFTQTHVHRVSDAIQPSHPLSSPSPPAPNPSQHQRLFQWVNYSHEVAKVLEFQL